MSQFFTVEFPRFPHEVLHDSLSKLVALLSQRHTIPDPLPFGIVSVWVLLIISFYHPSSLFRVKSKNTDEALDVLLTLISPTKSLWPKDIIQVASAHKDKIIKLPLSQLLSHIAAGTLEFRNPSQDLITLVKDGGVYRVDEWCIALVVDASWWITIGFWIFKSCVNIIKVRFFADVRLKYAEASPQPRNLLGQPFDDMKHSACTHWRIEQGRRRKSYTFDSIPMAQVGSFARELQLRLSSGTTNLEFTTRSERKTSLLVLCCVPFLLRNRTPTPLLMTLHRVIRMVTEDSNALAVESVQNYSEIYAAVLEQSVVDMTENPATRTAVIERCGMDGWRVEKFHTLLEAALFRAGFLGRWKVSVRKL